MNPGQIETICNGKYNERVITLVDTAKVKKTLKDKEAAWTIMERLKIPENGTVISGKMPDYFLKHFDAVESHLRNHFLLRKILRKEEFEILLMNCIPDGRVIVEKRLVYKAPKGTEKLKDELTIPFKDKHGQEKIRVEIYIKKADKELASGKPLGERGLLFYYGRYSVVDLTLGDYEADPAASKLFGEVKFEGEKLIRPPREEIIVEEKRRGLDETHPFVQKLLKEINKRIGKVVEEEREESEYTFDEDKKKKTLKELNKIAKELHGKGEPPPFEPPIKPEKMAFSPPAIEFLEFETRTVWLVINRVLLTKGTKISLESKNPKISVKPTKIEFKESNLSDLKKEFVVKPIKITAKEKIDGEVIAHTNGLEAKLGVDVLENPMFSPKDDFEFMPPDHKTTVIENGEKKIDLIINNKLIAPDPYYLESITIKSTNLQNIKVTKNPNKWEREKIRDITAIKIPVRGTKLGERGNIIANYKDRESEIEMKVISSSMSGFFKDINPLESEEGNRKIAYFNEDQGSLFFYTNHPLVKKYMKRKNFSKRDDFLVFIGDTLTREAIKAMVEGGIKNNSSRYPVFNPKDPTKKEIEDFIDRDYYTYGAKIHEVMRAFLKTMKL